MGCSGLTALGFYAVTQFAIAQQSPVTIQVEVVKRGTAKGADGEARAADASHVVVWLAPVDSAGHPDRSASRKAPQLVQRNKSFEPHVLVVEAGSRVEFPNKDPFFHNVFSLYDGKRFDLGLYEAGSSSTVHFDKPGVSFLFCNIHPEMSAVVVAVPSPYYGVSDRTGRVTIAGVPDGRYSLQVWYERSSSEELKALSQVVEISAATRSLDAVRIVDRGDFSLAHKNKYGQDYVPPANGGYVKP